MGLFTQDTTDLDAGQQILSSVLPLFNEYPGAAYSVSAELDVENIKRCCDAFDRITELGFPPKPGPFKRLGAFAILSQVWSPFRIQSTVSPKPEHFEVIWFPRMAVWSLPVFTSALAVDSHESCIEHLVLPTPHFQVEFIAYLRNIAFGVKTVGEVPDDYVLLERATATGLILEACAYAPLIVDPATPLIHSKATGCLEAILEMPIQADDWRFTDRRFLSLAVSIGVE